MDDRCFIDGCPGSAKFTCSCDDKLQICQYHIAEHISGTSFHDISALVLPQNRTQMLTNKAILNLSSLNSKALSEGKDMLKEVCEKLCGIVDNLSKRQQSLVELSTYSYSMEVEQKIQELEQVNIAFRSKNNFKNLLERYLSPEGSTLDSSSFEEFRSDFKKIVESLDKSNEVLQIVANSHKTEQLLRQNLEKKVEKLEKDSEKIENLEQRLKIVEIEGKTHLKNIDELNNELKKTNTNVDRNIKLINEKLKEIRQKGELQIKEFKDYEEKVRKNVNDNSCVLNTKYTDLEIKINNIQQVENPGLRQMLDKFFGEVNGRINVF